MFWLRFQMLKVWCSLLYDVDHTLWRMRGWTQVRMRGIIRQLIDMMLTELAVHGIVWPEDKKARVACTIKALELSLKIVEEGDAEGREASEALSKRIQEVLAPHRLKKEEKP